MAEQDPADGRRSLGLEGEEFETAALWLVAVFVFGFALLGVVVFRGRRKRRQDDGLP